MKKVVLNTPTQSVEIKLVDNEKYYGWSYSHQYLLKSDRGFISRDKSWPSEKEGFNPPPLGIIPEYRARSLYFLTSGNGYDFGSETLEDILEKLIKAGFTVYEFEDRDEFLKFLMD